MFGDILSFLYGLFVIIFDINNFWECW